MNVNNVLLISSVNFSEQIFTLAFKIFSGIFLNVLQFLGLKLLKYFSMTDKDVSKEEKDAGFLGYLDIFCISR